MSDTRQLLCTFSNLDEYQSIASKIRKSYALFDGAIFVFQNTKNVNELYLSYNIVPNSSTSKVPGTISIHRKKQTNTLYTLNALNQLIQDENGGVLDKTFQLDWELFKDSLIINAGSLVKIIPIKLVDKIS